MRQLIHTINHHPIAALLVFALLWLGIGLRVTHHPLAPCLDAGLSPEHCRAWLDSTSTSTSPKD